MEKVYKGIAPMFVETDDIESLSNVLVGNLDSGDVVIVKGENGERKYVVSLENEELMNMTYVSSEIVETIVYEKGESGWAYSETKTTELGNENTPKTYEVEDIEDISQDILNQLKCGDILILKTEIDENEYEYTTYIVQQQDTYDIYIIDVMKQTSCYGYYRNSEEEDWYLDTKDKLTFCSFTGQFQDEDDEKRIYFSAVLQVEMEYHNDIQAIILALADAGVNCSVEILEDGTCVAGYLVANQGKADLHYGNNQVHTNIGWNSCTIKKVNLANGDVNYLDY